MFDKRLRYFERAYNRGIMLDMEEVCTKDPTTFWNYVKNLGPRKKVKIPEEIIDDEGISHYDIDSVLDKWKQEFQEIYNLDSTRPL